MWWTRYSSKQRRRTAGDSAERLPPLAKTQTTSARGSSSTSSLNNTAPNAGTSAASNGEYLESTRFPVLRSSSCENPSNNDIGSLPPRDQLTPPGLQTNLNLQHLPVVGGRRLLLPPIHQQMGQIGQLQALCYLVVLILVSHFIVIWIFLLHFCFMSMIPLKLFYKYVPGDATQIFVILKILRQITAARFFVITRLFKAQLPYLIKNFTSNQSSMICNYWIY